MPRHADKRENQIIHAQQRARQRLGLNLSEFQLDQLVRDIQEHKLQFIERQSIRITVWRTDIEEMDVVVVYDRKRKMITTFIPYAWWEMRKGHNLHS